MKNLVTGATGFIGGFIAEELAKRGEYVRALVRKTSDIAFLRNLGVELFYGDMGDANSVRKAVKGVDKFNLPVVQAGSAELLSPPAEKALPWSERHAGLILIVLAAAVGLMLVFIIKNLKGLPRKDRQR